MVAFLLVVVLVVILYFINKDYNTNDYLNINLDKKQRLQGDLADHEAGILVAFLAKVAKSDGKVSDIEAKLLGHIFSDIANTFENSTRIRSELKQIYKNEISTFENIPALCEKYKRLNTPYKSKISLMQTLLALAFVDLDFSDSEHMICEDIANFIGIKKTDFIELVNMFEQNKQKAKNENINTIKSACEVLGVSEDSKIEDIKKAYRALVKKYHPDILRSKGVGDDGIKQANQKLQEINNAYDILKKEKKI